LHIGQSLGLLGERDSVAETAVERVISQINFGNAAGDLAHGAHGAIIGDDAAEVGYLVTVGQTGRVFRFGDVEAGDIQGFEAVQFACVVDAVAVGILPDAQVVPVGDRIKTINTRFCI
jgi:hypothetical protein